MRKLLLLLLCLACIPSLIAARDSDLRGKTVLFVYGGWEGHQPRQCHELLKPWLEAEGAVVISSESLDVYADKDLMNRVDLVIQTWTMGNLTREQEQGADAGRPSRSGTGGMAWRTGRLVPLAILNISLWWVVNG